VIFPTVVIPIFFYLAVGLGSLSTARFFASTHDASTFYVATAMLFAVCNGAGGFDMVADIQSGYFRRLSLSGAFREVLIAGPMLWDFVRSTLQAAIVLMTALLLEPGQEIRFDKAIAASILMALWGVSYAALGYSVALYTGSASAMQVLGLVFFPMTFLTTAYAPMSAARSWVGTASAFNPVTYFLEATREILDGASIMQSMPWPAIILTIGITSAVCLYSLSRRWRLS
jgi:ABC-2 type transport system permease protein